MGLMCKQVMDLRRLLVRWVWLGDMVLAVGCVHVTAGAQGASVDRARLGNAVAMDDVGTVRAQVEARAIGVNDRIPGIGYDATPMITVAARHASLNVLRYLIAAKADLNARTPDNDTALMLAAYFAQDNADRTAVSHERHDQAVRLLVDVGASLENEGPAYTPLAYAAYAGRDHAVRYLIEKGARVNANAQDGMSRINTPLMMATLQGHRNVARQLLRAGADAGVRVTGGMTAAELAQKHNLSGLLPMLRCAETLGPGESFSKRCE